MIKILTKNIQFYNSYIHVDFYLLKIKITIMLYSRTIQLIVIEMASMAVKYLIKAYEPRIAVYGASLHQQVFFTSKNSFFFTFFFLLQQ